MTDTQTPPTITDRGADHGGDVVAITEIIRDTETAFNTHDAELLAEHFAANGTGVSVTGAELVGRDQILATSRELFAGPLADQYARYQIDDLQFLGPEVALVRKLARAVDADGEPIDVGHTMRALYVLVKRDGRWWIAARQNTLISS